jgi:NADH-quinone oxidoreductase subunit I
VLTRDPDGEERCVACNLCAVACPVGCISLQKAEKEDGRWYPEFFRINFSRCIFCGMCEEACPTTAIQMTPDFELLNMFVKTWFMKRKLTDFRSW